MPPKRPKQKREKNREAVAFGTVISEFRLKAGISQEEFAYRCDSNRTFVSEIERGVKEPCLGSIFRMCRALATPAAELMREVEMSILNRP